MGGPSMSILLVIATGLLVVPLAAWLAITHAGPVVGAVVLAMVVGVIVLTAVVLRSIREGRM